MKIFFFLSSFAIGEREVSESDVTWPSMVTHIRNLCSAFNHPKCTHTAVNTHQWTHTHTVNTHREHTPGAVGSHFCCGTRGAVGAPQASFGALLKGTQSWYWRWRERCTFNPPTYNSTGPRLELTTFRLRVRLSNHQATTSPTVPLGNDQQLRISYCFSNNKQTWQLARFTNKWLFWTEWIFSKNPSKRLPVL